MSKRKFKVGDIVIGNKAASRYATTAEGCKLRVVKTYTDGSFYGALVKHDGSPAKGRFTHYTVRSDCFDLFTEATKAAPIEDTPSPYGLISTDGLIADYSSIKKQLVSAQKRFAIKELKLKALKEEITSRVAHIV